MINTKLKECKMHKIIAAILLSLPLSVAVAQHSHRPHHHHHHGHNWLAPAIIAGALGYSFGRQWDPHRVIIQPPYYVQQYVAPPQPQCWERNRYYNAYGQIVTEYICQ